MTPTPTPHTRSLPRAALLAFFTCLTALACTPDIPPPNDALNTPEDLLAAMRAADEPIHTARFKNAALQYYGEQGRISVRQTLLVGAPDRLRVQTYLPGFDDTAGVLVCACGRFAYHDRRENMYYYGDSDAKNIERFLPVGLTCADVGAVLLGGPPRDRIAAARQPALTWDREQGRYRLTFAEDGGQLALSVAHGTWRVHSIDATRTSGERRFHYEVEDFERIDGYTIPERRRFIVEATGEDISLRNGETQLNPELPDTLFGLEPPGGTPVRYVGSGPARPLPPGGDLCAADTPQPSTSTPPSTSDAP